MPCWAVLQIREVDNPACDHPVLRWMGNNLLIPRLHIDRSSQISHSPAGLRACFTSEVFVPAIWYSAQVSPS